MSISLPDEIKVTETAGTRRYVLPWRPMSPRSRRRFRTILVIAALAWATAASFIIPVILAWPNQRIPVVGVLSAGAGLATLFFALLVRFTRCTAEVVTDKLKLCEWRGPFANRRERSFEQIRAIVMHPLMRTDDPGLAETPVEAGVIEIQCDGIQPVWWAHDYPREWLMALAADLTERCALSSDSVRVATQPMAEPPPFILPLVADTDTADVEDRPPGCRVVVQRTAEGIELKLPPAGFWGNDQAKPRLVLAGYWTLIPILIVVFSVIHMLEQGLPAPPVWLFIGGLLCAGPALLLMVRHYAEREVTITVRNRWLARTTRSPVFGFERMRWRSSEILALRIAASPKKGKGPPTASLMLHPLNGPAVALLEASANQQEMGYIATLLRQALQVPAVVGTPPPKPDASCAHGHQPAESALKEVASPVRRRRQLLPPEILATPTATGTYYQLPWLNPTQLLRSRTFGCALLVLVLLAFGIWLCAGASLPEWLANGGNLRMAFGGMLLFFGITGLLAFLAMVIRRDAVEIAPEGLRFVQRMGLNVVRKQWPRQNIRRIVMEHYTTPPDSNLAEPLGVIEINGEGSSSHQFGAGYPVSMLLPLAEEMAERMNVPVEETEVTAAGPAPKSSLPRESESTEGDLRDEEKQPAASRAIVEENATGFSITLPPAGYRQNRRARNWLPFLLAALVFVLLNIVATARLAVIPKASVEQITVAVFWLAASIIVAALLAARVLHLAQQRTVITVQNGVHTVARSSPVARQKQQEWSRSDIAAIRLDYASRQMQTEKGRAVCLFTNDGRRINLITGDDEDEMRWLATMLRQALNVPAT